MISLRKIASNGKGSYQTGRVVYSLRYNKTTPNQMFTETDPPTTVTSKPPSSTTAVTTTAWETETLNEGQAIQKALQYLLQHRQLDWGWGNDTHHVMLTLQVYY